MAGTILVEGVGKRFRLFHERPRSFKEVIALRRRRSFDEFWALRDVSFRVQPGETIGVIGANGSGKSTLLKCLAKILTPDEGSIAVAGRVGALLELGAGFHPELTGRENVFLNGSILGVSRKELTARFDEIVALAGLERFIDVPVKNYSSGMYVRLGFAIAVTVSPDILLVDEVLAVGDEEFQRKSMAKFKEMRAHGRTVVLVTHALEAVREMCDRAVLLREGRVAEIGDALTVVDSYRRAVREAAEGRVATEARPSTGEVEITGVEFCGADGRRDSPITAGLAMRARIHWVAHAPVAAPVFQLEFLASTGIHVAEARSAPPGSTSAPLEGEGLAEFDVAELPFAPGEYMASAAVRSGGHDGEHAGQPRTGTLTVHPGQGPPRRGFMMTGHWRVTQSVRS